MGSDLTYIVRICSHFSNFSSQLKISDYGFNGYRTSTGVVAFLRNPQGFVLEFQRDCQAWRPSRQIKMSLFLILKQLGQRLFFFFSGKCRSHLDCLSSKYTIYVHCHNVYSKCKRVNVVFMLFLFIYLYWCPTRFQCQMMFLSYYRKTRNVTSITETSYTNHPEHLSSPLVLCRVRVVQSLVFCAVCYISQFFLLSVSLWPRYCLSFVSFLWPWYCLSFVSFTLAMIVSVFLDVRLLVTSLISLNLYCTLAKIVICPLSVF